MATAKVYTVVFAVVVLAIQLAPGPFFGPPEPVVPPGLLLGLPMLLIGWAWLVRIRRGIEKL